MPRALHVRGARAAGVPANRSRVFPQPPSPRRNGASGIALQRGARSHSVCTVCIEHLLTALMRDRQLHKSRDIVQVNAATRSTSFSARRARAPSYGVPRTCRTSQWRRRKSDGSRTSARGAGWSGHALILGTLRRQEVRAGRRARRVLDGGGPGGSNGGDGGSRSGDSNGDGGWRWRRWRGRGGEAAAAARRQRHVAAMAVAMAAATAMAHTMPEPLAGGSSHLRSGQESFTSPSPLS